MESYLSTFPIDSLDRGKMTIISWLKECFAKTGKTHRELAYHLGLAPSAISKILVGQRQLKATEAQKAANFFGIPLPDLDQDTSDPSNGVQVVQVPIRYIVRQGAWIERGAVRGDHEPIAYAADPRFARFEHFGAQIEVVDGGNISHPEVAILVSYKDARNNVPQRGDIVLVRRSKLDLDEFTVRLVRANNGDMSLVERDSGQEIDYPSDDTEIVGLVLGFYRPIDYS